MCFYGITTGNIRFLYYCRLQLCLLVCVM